MARIRGANTKPEVVVRKLLHGMGYRYRLHDRKLPGRPDIVLRRRRSVIFVHGCFWHQHPGCSRAFQPATNIGFWSTKFQANMDRDSRACTELARLGWRVLVVWECEVREPESLKSRLVDFLGPAGRGVCHGL